MTGARASTGSPPDDAGRPLVVVFGGSGFYGRYLVEDLLRHTDAEVAIASRRPEAALAGFSRFRSGGAKVSGLRCDIRDGESVHAAAAGASVVVHAAGPFRDLPLAPLEAAIARGIGYVDIAEDREFARTVRSREGAILASGATALTGISVSPAMEALVGALFRPRFERLALIRTFAAPDTRRHRGAAMFDTMLWGVGREYRLPRGGRSARVHGWTEPEWADFPPPFERRLTYLVHDMANLDLLPELLGVETVEFKAGSEMPWLNRLLGLAARIRRRFGVPRWEAVTPIVRALSRAVGVFGRDEGGVVFELGGTRNGKPHRIRFAVTAEVDGGRIPVALAGIAVEEMLAQRIDRRGLVPVDSWVDPERLTEGLLRRGLSLWWQTGDLPWQPFELAHLGLTDG